MLDYPTQTPCDAAEAEFHRLWGPWALVTPADVASILSEFTAPWWVAGGWALDAFTDSPRAHSDIDVAMFRADLPALRKALDGHLHIWSAGSDGIRPLDERFPEMPDSAEQVWLRRDAMSPWLLDVLLNSDRDGAWVNKRDNSWVAPLDQVTWVDAAGIRYLNPELVLLFKAKLARDKDRNDLVRTWPKLDDAQRATLRTYVDRHHPAHEWLPLMT
ncbi:nucleotidyltransferase domain-containing protein [Nocardia sp. NPDC052316]|uniref:nucleotidyltransferase domain-containing protein n=1 Tax=Nocardia sp. NPDC052316 TaxID=3364329 RepID=UPI0037CA23C5